MFWEQGNAGSNPATPTMEIKHNREKIFDLKIEQLTYNIVILVPVSGINNVIGHVNEWNAKEVAKKFNLTYYRSFWFEKRDKTITKGDNKEVLKIDIKTRKASGVYYINSYVESYEDIRVKNNPEEKDILTKMENLGCRNIVRSVEHDWVYPFRDQDKLVNFEGDIL